MFSNSQIINKLILPLSVFLALLAYYLLVSLLQPVYAVKAAAKLFLFFGLPLGYALFQGKFSDLLRLLIPIPFPWRRLLKLLIPGLLLVLVINLLAVPLISLFEIQDIIDDIVRRTQTNKLLLVAAFFYIPFINGLAEELFFRGFCFMELRKIWGNLAANLSSAAFFSVYHIVIINSWFSWPVLILSLAGLFVAGVILNLITRKNGDILGAWLLHALTNIAILSISFQFYPD